jgi:hypothetical protein
MLNFSISYPILIFKNLILRIPLKERIRAKAEEIGGGTEGDFYG